jgi:hypothetical protein
MTMANKHKTSVQKVATMLNRGGYLAMREQSKTGKMREIKLFRLKDVKREPIFNRDGDNLPIVFIWLFRYLISASIPAHFRPILHESSSYAMGYKHAYPAW